MSYSSKRFLYMIAVLGIFLIFMSNPIYADFPPGMVLIPGGSFEMGISEEDLPELAEMGRKVPHMSLTHATWWFSDEIPRHTVNLDSFYMDVHEVTNMEYEAFVEASGYQSQGNWREYATPERSIHPVVNVTWHDAQAYASWAGKLLPTEAEWEYAARGHADVKWFPWGDEPDASRANYRTQGETFWAGLVRLVGLRKIKTLPVGHFPPNGYGLYDMIGNVKEWCDATHEPYPGGPTDESLYSRFGPFKEPEPIYGKCVRGGSWDTPNAVFLRLTSRSGVPEEESRRTIGFRCVRSLNAKID